MFSLSKKTQMPSAANALPGRSQPMELHNMHAVLGTPLLPPFPTDCEEIIVGLGCFWGAERKFWKMPGVFTTAVGYSAGFTPNPTYREVCTGETGHNEVVRIVFNPQKISLSELLTAFWESHDPTLGMRQGGDVGTQYRSGLYYSNPAHASLMQASKTAYQASLKAAGLGTITTEILPATAFYYAENEHQQYLAKNPEGYCGLGGTGVSCPISAFANAAS